LVNILAVIETHGPFLQRLHGLGGRLAQSGAGAGFLDERKPVHRAANLEMDIVQRADGIGEVDLAGAKPPNGVERCVGEQPGLVRRGFDGVGRRLKVRQAENVLEFHAFALEVRQ